MVKRCKIFALFIGILFGIPLFAESPHSIHWKKIEAASGYAVEIRSETKKSIFQNTIDSSITVLLSVGKYEYRIGVYNKFKRIAKWSEWYDLEVRPLQPPVIHSQESTLQSDGTSAKLTFSGENIYEGTSAYVIQDGKKIPAAVKTSRDRKTSVVSVDIVLVDINKDYKIVLVNPNFESIEVPLLDKNTVEGEGDENKTNLNPRQTSTGNLWSLLWRQALVPGYGHYYHGEKKTAFMYWVILGTSSLYTAFEFKEYQTRREEYNTNQDTYSVLQATYPGNFTLPFFASTLLEENDRRKVADKAEIINSALTFIGAVYVTSLLHICYTGLTNKGNVDSKQALSVSFRSDAPNIKEQSTDVQHSRIDFKISFYY
jgi:hypothetical protein